MTSKVQGVELSDRSVPGSERVLTADALALVAHLTRRFAAERDRLLTQRRERQYRFDAGELPGPLPDTITFASANGKSPPRRAILTIAGSRSPARPSPR